MRRTNEERRLEQRNAAYALIDEQKRIIGECIIVYEEMNMELDKMWSNDMTDEVYLEWRRKALAAERYYDTYLK